MWLSSRPEARSWINGTVTKKKTDSFFLFQKKTITGVRKELMHIIRGWRAAAGRWLLGIGVSSCLCVAGDCSFGGCVAVRRAACKEACAPPAASLHAQARGRAPSAGPRALILTLQISGAPKLWCATKFQWQAVDERGAVPLTQEWQREIVSGASERSCAALTLQRPSPSHPVGRR